MVVCASLPRGRRVATALGSSLCELLENGFIDGFIDRRVVRSQEDVYCTCAPGPVMCSQSCTF